MCQTKRTILDFECFKNKYLFKIEAKIFFTVFINSMNLTISFQQNYNPTFGAKNIPITELEILLQKDKSTAQIARKYGVTVKTVLNRIKEYGLQLPSERLKERFNNEALPLLEQGVSFANVRKLTGIKEQYCRNWVKNNSLLPQKVLFNKHLEELFNSNYTDEQIADILCVEVTTVKKRRGNLGLKRKNGRPANNVDWTMVFDMFKKGKTANQIAKELQISLKLLSNKIKELSGNTPKKMEIEFKRNFINECLSKGDSISVIAEKLNIRREPLYKFIQKYLPEWVNSRKI